MSCPNNKKDPKQVPCPFVQHPDKKNLFVCSLCKKESQGIEKEKPISVFWWMIFVAVMLLVLQGKPNQPNPRLFNPTTQNNVLSQ